MGKKNKSGLGRSLVKVKGRENKHGGSWKHTSELNDAEDNQRFNISSITEQSALDDFLATAQLAGTEFTAEKLNVTIVTSSHNEGILTAEDLSNIRQAQENNRKSLRIPRRPDWSTEMTASELDLKERDSFLAWRRELAILQEKDHILLTPFEKNIEFWRQLWRVIERSDVIVQIVDARDPLLFRCEDLETYVKEVGANKQNLLLINKADYLTPLQRSTWAKYFKDQNIPVAFWSALNETEKLEKEKKETDEIEEHGLHDNSGSDQDESSEDERTLLSTRFENLVTTEQQHGLHDNSGSDQDESSGDESSGDENTLLSTRFENLVTTEQQDKGTGSQRPNSSEESKTMKQQDTSGEFNDSQDRQVHEEPADNCSGNLFSDKILSSEELIELCKNLCHRDNDVTHTTIGMVGYPNVGKSSTINAILRHKKVSVSATPGKTKHFQTLHLDSDVCLCDCPGLVFPSFVSTKAEMVVCGILPIDQMRDHLPPISLVCQRIPREVLELVYGINIAKPSEGDDPNRLPLAHELLDAYGYMRGFMTSHGAPDGPRSSRYILKDYVKGKLLYCSPPPGVAPIDFQDDRFTTEKIENLDKAIEKKRLENERHSATQNAKSSIDEDFFAKKHVRHFVKGNPVMLPGQQLSSDGVLYKPWKKHNNKNKREKLRRLEKKT